MLKHFMFSSIYSFIFVTAIMAIALPNYYQIFFVLFLLVLLTQIVLLKPNKNQLSVFIAILLVISFEYIVASNIVNKVSDTFFFCIQILLTSLYALVLMFRGFFMQWLLKNRTYRLFAGEMVLIKFFAFYAIPVDVLMLFDHLFVGKGVIYQYFEYFKVGVVVGLFLLFFDLFKKGDKSLPLTH